MPVLRPLDHGDARAILQLRLANREHVAWTEPDFPDGDARYTLAGVEGWLAREQHRAYGIDGGGVLAGTISLFAISAEPWRSAMTGYFIAREHEGRGLATAALGELLEIAFGELALHRVQAGTRADNVGSRRVLEKNGFTCVGLQRAHLLIGGEWVDHLLWEKLESD